MKRSLFDLVRILMGDVRTLLRQELMLFKTEMREKLSRIKGDFIALAVGGFAAWAGAMALLIGLALLLSWAFTLADIPPMLAGFIGFAVIGLLLAVIGGLAVMKALRHLSEVSLMPEKSVETLQRLAGQEASAAQNSETSRDEEKVMSQLSSEELQRLAFSTEDILDKTLSELRDHVSPDQIKERVKEQIQVPSVVVGATLVAGLLGLGIARRFRHA